MPIISHMQKILIYCLLAFFLVACDNEHKGYIITPFTGDYRYHNGIAEFFDCHERKRYYVAPLGIDKEVAEAYLALKLEDNDDAYISVEGYMRPEELMDGIATVDVFVITKLLTIDATRGCQKSERVGH